MASPLSMDVRIRVMRDLDNDGCSSLLCIKRSARINHVPVHDRRHTADRASVVSHACRNIPRTDRCC